MLVPLQRAAARCCCQSAVCALELLCALELGCWCRCCVCFGAWLVVLPLQGAAAGCCRHSAAVRVLCALLGCRGAGAVPRCRCKVLLLECRLRFGAWSLAPLQWVLLQGAAVRMLFALWSFVGARVSLWSLVAGATAGCCLRTGAWLLMPLAACRWKVLLSECCVRFGAWLLVPLQGARAGCRLQGAAARCCSE